MTTVHSKKIVFWGATGHAKVLRECVMHNGYDLVALFDNNITLVSPFSDVSLYHGEEGFNYWFCDQKDDVSEINCLIAIGGTRGRDRHQIQRFLESKGLLSVVAIHPSAFVAGNACIGKGSQILAKSAICVEVKIGESCIVNTGAIVDHDTVLSDGVHIGPGAHITGEVMIGKYTMVGAGAVVLPRVRIGDNVIVGAGSVVTKNIENNSTVYGNPSREKLSE
jgi:sugar O-acyltransferase (sialic acid O-acetyltransferase NeuD family)